MLTYRGDKFVKGKKFKINETDYRFSKRDDNKLIFEAISDGSRFVIAEDEYNKKYDIKEEAKVITEEGRTLNDREGYEEIYGEKADYTEMRKMVEALRAIAEQADEDGYSGVHRFENAINLLSRVYSDLEEFYERN